MPGEPSPGIVVMAKRPQRDRVKTRLAASIGPAEALRVYQRLLEQTKTTVQMAARELSASYGWWSAGEDGMSWSRHFDPNAHHHAEQRGPDLGARMHRAFADAFALGWTPVVMVGADVADLDAAYLRRALEALDEHDVVLGPAHDGGYVLIGLNFLMSTPFFGPEWGSQTVFADTCALLDRAQIRHTYLDVRRDLDTDDDLRDFPALKSPSQSI